MIVWVIAGLLGLATGLRIGWALVNKQSLVSTASVDVLGTSDETQAAIDHLDERKDDGDVGLGACEPTADPCSARRCLD